MCALMDGRSELAATGASVRAMRSGRQRQADRINARRCTRVNPIRISCTASACCLQDCLRLHRQHAYMGRTALHCTTDFRSASLISSWDHTHSRVQGARAPAAAQGCGPSAGKPSRCAPGIRSSRQLRSQRAVGFDARHRGAYGSIDKPPSNRSTVRQIQCQPPALPGASELKRDRWFKYCLPTSREPTCSARAVSACMGSVGLPTGSKRYTVSAPFCCRQLTADCGLWHLLRLRPKPLLVAAPPTVSEHVARVRLRCTLLCVCAFKGRAVGHSADDEAASHISVQW